MGALLDFDAGFEKNKILSGLLPELVAHVDPVDGDQGGVEEPHHVGGHDPGVEEPMERILDKGASQTNDLTAHADQYTLISHNLRHEYVSRLSCR